MIVLGIGLPMSTQDCLWLFQLQHLCSCYRGSVFSFLKYQQYWSTSCLMYSLFCLYLMRLFSVHYVCASDSCANLLPSATMSMLFAVAAFSSIFVGWGAYYAMGWDSNGFNRSVASPWHRGFFSYFVFDSHSKLNCRTGVVLGAVILYIFEFKRCCKGIARLSQRNLSDSKMILIYTSIVTLFLHYSLHSISIWFCIYIHSPENVSIFFIHCYYICLEIPHVFLSFFPLSFD